MTLEKADFSDLEMIVLPGGLGGVASCRASKGAMDALTRAWQDGKFVAAICAGPTVLADLGITDGKTCTGLGGANMSANASAVQDGRLITGTSAGCAIPFGLKLIEALKDPEAAETIRRQIVIR